MIYIFLAILGQVWNANLLKIGETAGQDRLVVLGFNYLSATALAIVYWAVQHPALPGTATLVVGPVAGFFYAASLFCFMVAISRAGLGMATATMRLSVIWPTLLSLTVFGEVPTPVQLAGVVLTLLVVVLLGERGMRGRNALPGGDERLWWLLALFLTMGAGFSSLKVFNELSPPAEKSAMLSLLFFSAGVWCWAFILAGKRTVRRGDVGRGLLFGVSNVVSNALALMGLERVAGVVAFPMLNVGVILLASVSGMVFWRERPQRVEIAAIALAALAILLMTR